MQFPNARYFFVIFRYGFYLRYLTLHTWQCHTYYADTRIMEYYSLVLYKFHFFNFQIICFLGIVHKWVSFKIQKIPPFNFSILSSQPHFPLQTKHHWWTIPFNIYDDIWLQLKGNMLGKKHHIPSVRNEHFHHQFPINWISAT